MTEHDVLHARLDNLEEKIGKMADAVTKMADAMADIKVQNERLSHHAAQIDNLDKRLDTVEGKVPVYDLFVSSLKRIAMVGGSMIVVSLLSLVIFQG